MTVVRLPSWSELLEPGAPWAVLLRARPEGLWLLRGEAEPVEGLVVRVVDGRRCSTSEQLFREWAAALDFPDDFGQSWSAFEHCMRTLEEWLGGSAVAILVSDADRILDGERNQLATLLEILGQRSSGRVPVRLVFQASREADDDRLAVFREFGVVEAA
jgi:Barstar (barnase inhibitor)